MSREVARGGGVGEKRLADDGELGKLNILDALLDAAGKLCEPALLGCCQDWAWLVRFVG